jgi:pyridoxal phosphate enzyme (YggS family)
MHAAQPIRSRPAEGPADRLATVRGAIAEACERVGRGSCDVRIVAITKGHSAAVLKTAVDLGLTDIGENRVHEALVKFNDAKDVLSAAGIERHMVGHLQRNKVRDAIALFEWIQSVDSIRLARAISTRAEGRTVNALVQVNVAGETQKYGFEPGTAVESALEIAELDGIRVRGLMTMAPWTEDTAVIRKAFLDLRRLFDVLQTQSTREKPDTLSMGMTNDYEIAVEEGSTMVRLGTVLFGPRPTDA